MQYAFSPRPNATSRFTCDSTTSSGTSISMADTNVPPQTALLQNSGTMTAFVEVGSVTTNASANTSMPLGPGATRIISLGSATKVSAITAGIAGTTVIYVTPGEGGA